MRRSLLLLSSLLLAGIGQAQVRPDAVLIRYPDVSRDQIAFRYDGDIWTVDKRGGTASRVSSSAGPEALPRFSPDGTQLAMMGGWEGSTDVYVLDLVGGSTPKRLTFHPSNEVLNDWHPDGKSVLFWSARESGIGRSPKIYQISTSGGAAKALPVPYGTFGTIDPSGEWLAYTPITREFRTWKRYQGGMAQDIWLFNLRTNEARKMTDHPGTDAQPMWHGRSVVFISDRGPNARLNLWMFDLDSGQTTQLTSFSEWDVKFPAVGPDDVVFENGGKLWRYEFASGQSVAVDITIPGDRRKLHVQSHDVADMVSDVDVSPNAKRAVVSARGNLFSVPLDEGFVRTLTETSDAAEREPAWSPDGKWIAYYSDADGEYDLYLRRSNGKRFAWGEDTQEQAAVKVASLGTGWKNGLDWSPDSKKILFGDNFSRLTMVTVADGSTVVIDTEPNGGALGASWSPDSRWLTYERSADGTLNPVIFVYGLEDGQRLQVTSELFSAHSPTFGQDGDWLYFTSNRSFSPTYSDFDDTWIYANSQRLCAIPLRADVENPWAPRNEEEIDDDENEGEDEDESEADSVDADGSEETVDDDVDAENDTESDVEESDAGDDEEETDEDEVEPVDIEFEAMESRAVLLPLPAGNYTALFGLAEGKLLYANRPRAGSNGETPSLMMYELGEEKAETVIGGISRFAIATEAKKLLVEAGGQWGVIDIAPKQKIEEPLEIEGLFSRVNPRLEWEQIMRDAHRMMRDYFYDAQMHGVDWDAVRDRYIAAMAEATSRDDVHYLIGEMIGELNVGHAYNRAPSTGLQQAPSAPNVGLLGCDWSVENGRWRITNILDGGYDYDARSPLSALGVDVQEGDYVLAVNGSELTTEREVYAAFTGTAGRSTELVVNAEPTLDGNERHVLVKPVGSESALRYRAWVAAKRAEVERLSEGRIGYVHVPDTGVNGQNELVRQYSGQYFKEALLVDERWNGGGQIPTRFIELLNRPNTNHWATRTAEFTWPMGNHVGPKAMLINESAGSGGDAFPYYFRQSGLGKLIGTRTWGGLVGISGGPTFVDGATISVPAFAFFELDNTWGVEGHGVDPDIEVVDDPSLMVEGGDPQLQAAVDHLLGELKSWRPSTRVRPASPDRRGAGIPLSDH